MKKDSPSLLLKNKKAYHNYEIIDDFEAGIQLEGHEVKSVKAKHISFTNSYITIENDEAFVKNIHLSPYKNMAEKTVDPTRKRKLLLNKKEIARIAGEINEKGISCVPLEFYLKKSLIKLKIGICKGKKLYDKRAELKKKAQNLEISRALKRK